jgi:DNA-binding NarL/FixJ family response regulator
VKRQWTPEKKNKSGIYLLDSYQVYREGFRSILAGAPDLEIIDIAENEASVVEHPEIGRADIVIVDADLPGKSGIEVCLILANSYPSLKTILLCENEWDIYLVSAYKSHSAGILVRRAPATTLVDSLRQVSYEPLFTTSQLNRIEEWQRTIGSQIRSLKPREWKTLMQVSSGQSNHAIADWLGISKGSVEKYISHLLVKFDLSSRSALVAYFHNHHLEIFSRLPDEIRVKLLA